MEVPYERDKNGQAEVSQTIVRTAAPEEYELEIKRRELSELEAELVARELELATESADMRAFEIEYLNRVGSKYVELDALEARIAEVLASREPLNDQLRQNREEADAKSHRSSAEFKECGGDGVELMAKLEDEELKRLYRDLAKKIHPDLAEGDTTREVRAKLMAEANAAYRQGDKEALARILAAWRNDESAVIGNDVAHQLVRVIRRTARIRERVKRIQEELLALQNSELAKLRNRVRDGAAQGRDAMAELASRLEGRIAAALARLEQEGQRA